LEATTAAELAELYRVTLGQPVVELLGGFIDCRFFIQRRDWKNTSALSTADRSTEGSFLRGKQLGFVGIPRS
jgi:hypothetical protein